MTNQTSLNCDKTIEKNLEIYSYFLLIEVFIYFIYHFKDECIHVYI